jgi:hypothetical protein
MSDDPLFRGLVPPALPPGLREDALAAARGALGTPPAPPDVWASLLASPAARLAWAATVAALAAANVFFPKTARPPAASVSAAAEAPDAEIASIARLPRIDDHALPTPEGGRS